LWQTWPLMPATCQRSPGSVAHGTPCAANVSFRLEQHLQSSRQHSQPSPQSDRSGALEANLSASMYPGAALDASALTPYHDQLLPARGIPRRAVDTPHDPAWLPSHRSIAYCPRAPLRLDRIERRHQPLRALAIVPVKEMRLHLMGWHQCGQDDTGFLVAIALTKELCDASKSIPEQLGGVLGGDG